MCGCQYEKKRCFKGRTYFRRHHSFRKSSVTPKLRQYRLVSPTHNISWMWRIQICLHFWSPMTLTDPTKIRSCFLYPYNELRKENAESVSFNYARAKIVWNESAVFFLAFFSRENSEFFFFVLEFLLNCGTIGVKKWSRWWRNEVGGDGMKSVVTKWSRWWWNEAGGDRKKLVVMELSQWWWN